MSRDHILHKVRTALGRGAGPPAGGLPPVRIRIPVVDLETRIEQFVAALTGLAGKACRAASPGDACHYVAERIRGGSAVASNAPFLEECGITRLPGVRSAVTDRTELGRLCATADFGITSADYALADTGTLVMLSSRQEARIISLLPPVHLAVVPKERILTGLDELFTVIPDPSEKSSSMVLITGPSRTGDIEQVLVRGVHGPGEIHVVIV